MASNITLAVTSCGRHDLLKQTLESFCNCTDIPPQQTIIIEDGDIERPDWLNERRFRDLGPVTWITNGLRMGQIYSIDRLYQETPLSSSFIARTTGSLRSKASRLHLWRFSRSILRYGASAYGELIAMVIRSPLTHDARSRFTSLTGVEAGVVVTSIPACDVSPTTSASYGRHTAYGTHGLGHELQLSKMHLDMGYRIAVLPQIHVVHTGGGRSRAIEPMPALPKVLIAVPACHKFEYSKWESEQSPHFDPDKAYNGQPYGTDIHISGDNPRIDAVRETWFKDIDPFKAHVTGKFFYGEPQTRSWFAITSSRTSPQLGTVTLWRGCTPELVSGFHKSLLWFRF